MTPKVPLALRSQDVSISNTVISSFFFFFLIFSFKERHGGAVLHFNAERVSVCPPPKSVPPGCIQTNVPSRTRRAVQTWGQAGDPSLCQPLLFPSSSPSLDLERTNSPV